jgi:hypothetical protein
MVFTVHFQLRSCPVGLLFLVFGNILKLGNYSEDRRGRDRMVVEFTTTCTYYPLCLTLFRPGLRPCRGMVFQDNENPF